MAAAPPVLMANLGGFRVCGKRGGKAFFEVERAPCKEGFFACSNESSLENTVCVSDKKDCPITDILWAQTANSSYHSIEINNKGFLLFSKNTDSLPVISLKLLKGKPCLDPSNTDNPRNSSYFEPDLRNFEKPCQPPLFNKKVGKIDSRYKRIGFKVDENTLMGQSKVHEILFKKSGGHIYNYDYHYKTDQVYEAWSRPTIPWKLKCDDRRQQTYTLV